MNKITNNKINIFKKAKKIILPFFEQVADNKTGMYSASTSYFVFLSVVPFLIAILTIIPFTPVTKEDLLVFLLAIIPNEVKPFVELIITELYGYKGTIMSFSLIIAIWSAAKGFMSIMKAFDEIFGTRKKKGYFLSRAFASVYTSAFMLALLIIMIMGIFAHKIELIFIDKFDKIIPDFIYTILSYRFVIYIPIIFLLIFISFLLLPDRKPHIRHILPGAVFATTSWIIFTQALSVFMSRTTSLSMYGSLATIVLVLVWFYFLMYILLIGANINYYIFYKSSVNNNEAICLQQGGETDERKDPGTEKTIQ